jgi:hypothetical protein
MKRTESQAERSTSLSHGLFDEVLVRLAHARRDANAAPYFPPWRDGATSSYFTPSSVGAMSPRDFEFPGGGTVEGLVDALTAFWTLEREPALAGAGPWLKAIANALRDEAQADDGNVDIFCYTLF